MAFRVECAGRSDRPLENPYEAQFWYEGRRPGTNVAPALWASEGGGVGVVASASGGGPGAHLSAAAAVDAFRRALADPLPLPSTATPSVVEAERAVRRAVTAANDAVLARAAAHPGRQAALRCSLAAAVVADQHAIVVEIGGCAAFAFRDGVCHAVARLVVDAGMHQEDASDAPPLLGEHDRVRIPLRTFGTHPEDVLVLVSEGVASRLNSPEEIGDILCRSTTLEGACEQLLLEARLHGGASDDCVVLVGIDLKPTGRFFVDPARDPLPFALALRMASQPGSLGERAPRARRMLGISDPETAFASGLAVLTPGHGDAGAPSAIAMPLPTEGPTGPAAPTKDGAVAEAQPVVPKPRRRPRRLVVVAALAVAAGSVAILLGTGAWAPLGRFRAAADGTPSLSAGAPSAPAVAEVPATSSPLGEATYQVSVRPEPGALGISSGETSPATVAVAIQEHSEVGWTDVARATIAPGEDMRVALPDRLSTASVFEGRPLDLRFRLDPSGRAVWSAAMSLADLPRRTSLSIDEYRVNAADRRSGLLIVLQPTPASEREPWFQSHGSEF